MERMDLDRLDSTLQGLWDLRQSIDAANDRLMDNLAARQRDFLRALTEHGPVPPSPEVASAARGVSH